MADTPRSTANLLALFADNTSGAITAQDCRDLIVSLGYRPGGYASGESYYPGNDVLGSDGVLYKFVGGSPASGDNPVGSTTGNWYGLARYGSASSGSGSSGSSGTSGGSSSGSAGGSSGSAAYRSRQTFTGLTAMPSDMVYSGTTVDTTTGNPAPALRTTGSGPYYYFNDPSNWSVASGKVWTYAKDLYIKSGGREIDNVAFWVQSPGANATGFFFRVDSSANSIGFYQYNGTSHTSLYAPNTGGAPQATWMNVLLSCSGNTTVRAQVYNAASGNALYDLSYDFASAISSAGTGYGNTGTFGQAPDGAGDAGQLHDNLTLTGGV